MNQRLKMTTLQAIRSRLAVELALDPAQFAPDRPFGELGIDSLTLTECLFKLEDEFSVSLGSTGAMPATLRELAALIDRLLAEKRSAGD